MADNTYCAFKYINNGRFLLFEILHMINSMVNTGQCFLILGLGAPCPTCFKVHVHRTQVHLMLPNTGCLHTVLAELDWKNATHGMSAQCPTWH